MVWLQALIDRTFARANPHLASIVKPERRLSARQVVTICRGRSMSRSRRSTSAVSRGWRRSTACSSTAASPSPRAETRLDCATCAPTRLQRRARRRRRRSPSSSTGTQPSSGAATPACDEIEPIWTEIYGSSPFSWGDGVVFMRIEPTSMWAYAFHPERSRTRSSRTALQHSVARKLSAILEPDALAAAVAALEALGEEERALAPRQLVAEETAEKVHGSGPTRTSIFPTFSPSRRPMNARGADSIPSTTVSR